MGPEVKLPLHLNDSVSQDEGSKIVEGVETAYGANLPGMVNDTEEHQEDNVESFPHTFAPAGHGESMSKNAIVSKACGYGPLQI